MTNPTPNKFLNEPARGSFVGTWDTPVNANMDIVDASFGGVTTVALTNSNVVLSQPQYQNAFLVFTGALAASVTITLPTIGSFYTAQNLTSNTSAFTVTLATTAAGSQAIAIPPGEPIDVFTDGTNVKFRNLGRIGQYLDMATSSMPSWMTICTIPPYLNCDGTSFSSGTYPILATVLSGTTLPDLRGRLRATLNQGSSRITSSGGGVDGTTLLAAGGQQNSAIAQANIPNYNLTVTDPGHFHLLAMQFNSAGPGAPANTVGGGRSATTPTDSATTGITVNSGGSGTALLTLPPIQMAGITIVRAG